MYPLGFSGDGVTYVMEVRMSEGFPHEGQNLRSGSLQSLSVKQDRQYVAGG